MRPALYPVHRWFSPLLLLAFLVACSEPGPQLSADDWPQFRGHGGNAIVSGTLPTEWGAGDENVRWSSEVPGFGRASPIVAGGRLFLAIAEPDEKSLGHGIVALDASTGEQLWKTTVASRKKLVLKNRFGVHSGATPVTDGQAVYAYFGAELAALDVATGQLLWEQVVEDDYEKTTRYGAGSSPVLAGDLIIILQDKEYAKPEYDVGWLAAFDRATGEERWRVEFDDGCCSYVTPTVRQTAAGAEVVVALSRKVVAYAAATGELLWEDDQDMNQPVASAVLIDDLLCIASGAHNVRETVCRRLTGSGSDTDVEVLWRTSRAVAETASPVLYEGRLYVVTQKGVLTTYDALTGQILWRVRLEAGAYHGSLLAGDGKIYAFNNNGVTTVLASASEEKTLAVNQLGERSTIATPAVAGGRLYMRLRDRLVCIESTGGG